MNRNSLLFGILIASLLSCSEPAGAPVLQNPPVPATSSLPPDTLPQMPAADTLPAMAAVETPALQAAAPQTAAFSSRTALISFARQYLGTPYVFAKSDPKEGFDCSGFINYVYRHFGFQVPRSSIDFRHFGKEVPLAEAQIGDLLLFTGAQDTDRIGHIGIITKAAGPDCEFIHASSGKEMAVTFSSLAAPHYKKRFVKVVDVISK